MGNNSQEELDDAFRRADYNAGLGKVVLMVHSLHSADIYASRIRMSDTETPIDITERSAQIAAKGYATAIPMRLSRARTLRDGNKPGLSNIRLVEVETYVGYVEANASRNGNSSEELFLEYSGSSKQEILDEVGKVRKELQGKS
ncbi:MAG: hypothetical protein U9O94_03800 [Nanoarchaeota archaeon]|nr:hypothetical protein [Nanoarchaeota archaeon]